MNAIVNHTIKQLIEINQGDLWMGKSLEKMIGQIKETDVFIRPIEELHSIAEIVSHITFWRREALLKINSGRGSKTEDSEGNWLPNEKLKPIGWRKIKSDHDRSLNELIALLRSKNDVFLDDYYYDNDYKGNFKYSFLIKGMLHHDLYHLGQLGLVVKFLKLRAN